MDIALERSTGCPSGLAPAECTENPPDPAAFVSRDAHGDETLELMVAGARCAGCISKIEGALRALPGVTEARLNLSTQRLRVAWHPPALEASTVVETLARIGYTARAFDPEAARQETDEAGRKLLRYLAVAGFAAMNIMMFSVPVWSGDGEMGTGTRTLLHWVSALIAVPAALYAAQPFFGSAYRALKARRANMDVPVSLAVLLALGMSVAETLRRGEHAYFDSVVMLLFFLLIGRYLDHRLRQRARTAASDLLALQAVSATRIDGEGKASAISARDIAIGDRILLSAGDRVPVEGFIEDGVSELDTSLLTGETMPLPVQPGEPVHAGAINLTSKLVIRATARAADSSVAELSRLIETGEQARAQFVRLADRAAAIYVPLVHTLAALTFLGWLLAPTLLRYAGIEIAEIGPQGALQNAIAVLIITCPCALALAVPAVQVVATGQLFKRGVLVKSGDALERLEQIDTVVFDKTGTLTLGKPQLANTPAPAVLQAAAQLARASRHPLARALVAAAGPGCVATDALEIAGAGVEGSIEGRPARLGSRSFAAPSAIDAKDGALELWFNISGEPHIRFSFEDALRPDAGDVVRALRERGFGVELISGDRTAAVAAAANAIGLSCWRADMSPTDKVRRLRELAAAGRKVFMIGDGLNDAAALAAAHVSASPGTAIDATQAAADLVIQGAALSPLLEALDVAKAARRRAMENIAFSAVYNAFAAPAAMAGLLTPLIAALAMSGSSLLVTLNALRLQVKKRAA